MKAYLLCFLLLAWMPIRLSAQEPSARNRDRNTDTVELGDLKSRVPPDWIQEPPDNPGWYRQYRLVPIDDDKTYARVTIQVPAKAKGDAADEYVKRWRGMFFPPPGMTSEQAVRLSRFTVQDARVTSVSVRGDYKGIPGDAGSPRPNYRLLGVYFDATKGPYVIRLFGPADTVGFYQKEFEDWVKSFK